MVERPIAAAVGRFVVVWGGHGGGRYRAGGWVVDGSRHWRRITGAPAAMHGMLFAGANSTGRTLVVMGMRCDLTDAQAARDDDDAEPCEGNPRLVVQIDPRSARATRVTSPSVARTSQANGGFGIGWDGRRAWFRATGGSAAPEFVGFDPVARSWARLPAPPNTVLEHACVVGRQIIGIEDRDGPGQIIGPAAARTPAIWSWERGAWSQVPSAPVANVIIELGCQGGVVIASGCVNRPSSALFEPERRSWRAVPPVPECLQAPVARIGDTVVASSGARLFTWHPGATVWTPLPPNPTVDAGFDPFPSVYRGALLLVGSPRYLDLRDTRLRLVAVGAHERPKPSPVRQAR